MMRVGNRSRFSCLLLQFVISCSVVFVVVEVPKCRRWRLRLEKAGPQTRRPAASFLISAVLSSGWEGWKRRRWWQR